MCGMCDCCVSVFLFMWCVSVCVVCVSVFCVGFFLWLCVRCLCVCVERMVVCGVFVVCVYARGLCVVFV